MRQHVEALWLKLYFFFWPKFNSSCYPRIFSINVLQNHNNKIANHSIGSWLRRQMKVICLHSNIEEWASVVDVRHLITDVSEKSSEAAQL